MFGMSTFVDIFSLMYSVKESVKHASVSVIYWSVMRFLSSLIPFRKQKNWLCLILYIIHEIILFLSSNKKQEGESDWETEQRRKSRSVWLAGRQGVTELEAALAIVAEAKTIIQQELGVAIQWQSGDDSTAEGNSTEDGSPSPGRHDAGRGGTGVSKAEGKPSSARDRMSSAQSATTPARHSRKRKSDGGSVDGEAEAHSQPRRSLSCRSGQQRRISSRSLSHLKSPPSGGRTGAYANRSPKDVSFFGQVVVSPPPCMKTQVQQNAGGSSGGGHRARSGLGVSHDGSVTPTAGTHNTGGVRLFARQTSAEIQQPSLSCAEYNGSHGSVEKDGTEDGHFDLKGMRVTSARPDTSTHASVAVNIDDKRSGCAESSRKDGCDFKGVKEHEDYSDSVKELVIVCESPDDGKVTTADKRHFQSTARTKYLRPLLENNAGSGVSGLGPASEGLCDDSAVKPSAESVSTHNVSLTVDKEQCEAAPEKKTSVSSTHPHSGNEEDGCFDDSFILNTQTDNLLSGRSSVPTTAVKGSNTVTTSTPLVSHKMPAADMSGLSMDASVNSRQGVNGSRQVSLKDTGSENNTDGSRPQQHSRDVTPAESQAPAVEGIGERVHSDHRQAPPQAVLPEDDQFTGDLFTSPLVSLSGNAEPGQPVSVEMPRTETESAGPNRFKPKHIHSADNILMDAHPDSDADESAELIAASNYDRVAFMEEGMIADSTDTSYQDLAINTTCVSGSSDSVVGEDNADDRVEDCDDLALVTNLGDSFSPHTHVVTARVGTARTKDGVESTTAAVCTEGTDPGRGLDGFSTRTRDSVKRITAAAHTDRTGPGRGPDRFSTRTKDGTERTTASVHTDRTDPGRGLDGFSTKIRDDVESTTAAVFTEGTDPGRGLGGFSTRTRDGVERTNAAVHTEKTDPGRGPDGFSTRTKDGTERTTSAVHTDRTGPGRGLDGFSTRTRDGVERITAAAHTEGTSLGRGLDRFSTSTRDGTERDAAAVHTEGTDPGHDPEGFSTSFTASMMEQALAEDSFSAGDSNPAATAVLKKSVGSKHQEIEGASASAQASAVSRKLSPRTGAETAETAHAKAETSGDGGKSRETSSCQKDKQPHGSTTPQNNGDYVPPTPPEESSTSVLSPCVRRTPMRACRNKSQAPEQSGHSVSRCPTTGKKKHTPREKENRHSQHKSQNSQKSSQKAAHEADRVHRHSAKVISDIDNPQSQSDLSNIQDQRKALTDTQSLDLPAEKPEKEIPVQLDSPPPSQDCLCVIDVCASADLFATFVEEWRSQSVFSLSLACEKKPSTMMPGGGIGSNFMPGQLVTSCFSGFFFVFCFVYVG